MAISIEATQRFLWDRISDDQDQRRAAREVWLRRWEENEGIPIRDAIESPDFARDDWLIALAKFAAWTEARDSLDDHVETGELIRAAGSFWLPVLDALLPLLDSRSFANCVADVLAEIGPPAAPLFADELWRRVFGEEIRPHNWSSFISALAAMIRDDNARVARVIDLARRSAGEEDHVSFQRDAGVLEAIGPRAREVWPDIVPWLLSVDASSEIRYATSALGTVGAGSDEAVDALLARSFTDDPWLKGECLRTLGRMRHRPDLVVPRLIAALDDYEEPDSDNVWFGDYFLVCDALANFGESAAPAVPALLEKLHGNDGNLKFPDQSILHVLGAIGPPAASALPLLQPYVDEDMVAEYVGGANETDVYHERDIDYVVARLRGLIPLP